MSKGERRALRRTRIKTSHLNGFSDVGSCALPRGVARYGGCVIFGQERINTCYLFYWIVERANGRIQGDGAPAVGK